MMTTPKGRGFLRYHQRSNRMNEIVIFETSNGDVQVQLAQESVWLTQKQMGQVFGTTPENILMHLKNIYADDELPEISTTKDFLVVQTEGNRQVSRQLKHYNLDAIISVGYRVNSKQAVQFRQWATKLLKQHRIVTKVDETMALCDTLKTNLQNAQTIQLTLADALVEQAVG
jgi:hypothetical protein